MVAGYFLKGAQLQAAIVISFLVVAAVIWLVMLRPVEKKTAQGTVTRKTHKPEGEYWQYQPGTRAGFHMPTKITIAEGYVLEIECADLPKPIYTVVNTVEARQYEVGDQVSIEWVERSIPGIWKKAYVSQLTKPSPPSSS